MDADFASIDRDFRDLCVEAAEAIHRSDTQRSSGGQRLSPACLLRRKIQRTKQSRLIRQQRTAKLHGVFARGFRQFIDKAFGEKRVLGMADGAPVVGRNLEARFAVFHLNVWNVIKDIGDAGDAFPVETVAQSGKRRAGDAGRPRGQFTGCIQPSSELHVGCRPEAVRLQIVLTCVREFHRNADSL